MPKKTKRNPPPVQFKPGDRFIHKYIGMGTYVKKHVDGVRCWADMDSAQPGENPQPVTLCYLKPYPPKS